MDLKGVLMLSDSFYPVWGGREMVIHRLMENLDKRINILLGAPKFTKKEVFDDGTLTYRVVRCDALSITKNEVLAKPDKAFKKQIEDEIKSGKIQVIHVQTKYSLMKYAFKLRRKYGLPIVASVHTHYPSVYKRTLKFYPIYNFAENRVIRLLNKVDCIVSVSEFMKKELIKMGVKNEIEVISNGNNYAGLTVSDEDIKKVNNLYGWAPDEKVLLCIARVCAVKGIDIILEAISKVKSPVKMVFVGCGEIDSYTNLAKSLNVAEKCQFLGQINDHSILKAICARSLIHVFPSVTDTFGLTIYECGALGTPSIVTANMATAEQIKDGFNGFITDGSSEEIAKKIDEILSEKLDLKSVAENARRTMNLTWDEVIDKYLEMYNNVLNNY